MKKVLHIVRKDFRHLRFYLAGWLGLVILRAAVIGYGPLDSGTWDYDSFFYYQLLAWFPQTCLLPIMVGWMWFYNSSRSLFLKQVDLSDSFLISLATSRETD